MDKKEIQKDLENKRHLFIAPSFFSEEQVKSYGLLKFDELEENNKKVSILISQHSKNDKDGLKNVIDLLREHEYKIINSLVIPKETLETFYEYARSSQSSDKSGSTGEGKETFDRMLEEALRQKCSDIHIIVTDKNGAQILFRVDGDLIKYMEISRDRALTMIRAVYNADSLEKEDSQFDEKAQQQAIIPRTISNQDIQLRFQSSKTFDGFKVVMRILNLGTKEDSDDVYNYKKLDELGYGRSHVENIEAGILKPVGATIIAGVTGSGKSTTLKHLLMFLNHKTGFVKSFYTIEDPPEYKIPGVIQIGVLRGKKVEKDGSPFAKTLKTLMRFDPDVIMIGEIRDEFTAESLTKTTESGHKVLSTTHASSALEIVKRFYGFGVEANDMASPSFLSCLIYQKLLPVLCPHCKEKLKDKLQDADVPDDLVNLKNRLEKVCDVNKDDIYIRKEGGCEHCKGRGISGRTVCAETIVPDLTLLTLFRDNKMIEAKEYWRSLSDKKPDSDNFNGKTVLEHALYKMRKGEISPVDIEIELGVVDASYNEWLEIEKREENKRQNNFFGFDQHVFSGVMKKQNNDENDFNL